MRDAGPRERQPQAPDAGQHPLAAADLARAGRLASRIGRGTLPSRAHGEEGAARTARGDGRRRPSRVHRAEDGAVLVLRGVDDARARARSTPTRSGGNPLSQEDAWQRAVEFLFERLAVRWEIAGAEPITRQKELLARFRFASADERRWIRDVLREHLAEHFPDMGRRDRTSTRFAAPARRLLPRGAARPAGRWSRSTTLAAPLLLALQREILERDAWPLLRVELPGQPRASGRRRATRQLDELRPGRAGRGARASTRRCGSRPPENTHALAGVDPARMARAARAAAPLREARLAQALVRSTLWPTPAPPSRPAWARASSRAFVERALFLDREDPVAAWGELRERSRRG